MRKRDLYIIVGAVLTALIFGGVVLAGVAVETGSWGLCFQSQGTPPQGPLDNQRLNSMGAAYLGNTSEKVLYLTFDAGYENGCTAQILDVLAKHNVKAAFFLVGHYMQSNPDLVRRMAAEGHTVGNHSMHHPDMTKLSQAEFEKEIRDLEALYQHLEAEHHFLVDARRTVLTGRCRDCTAKEVQHGIQ